MEGEQIEPLDESVFKTIT
jgi:hypothetical protein